MNIIDKAIPTNIITGFLGVGKTTTILELLKTKPAHEKWAVLVNEFGEIGIDGELLNAQNTDQQRITIKEVAGGCMCCAAGVSTQVALNQLIKEAKPDRLLIEPTGLGHPKEVIHILHQDVYKDVLAYKNTLTIIDPRHSHDERYTHHDIYLQQLDVADIFICNKSDQYNDKDLANLQALLTMRHLQDIPLIQTKQGAITPSLLDEPSQKRNIGENKEHNLDIFSILLDPNLQAEKDSDGYIRKQRQHKAFYSTGWIFDEDTCFDYFSLNIQLSGLNVERLKAIMNTDQGSHIFNYSEDILSTQPVEHTNDSRLELICDNTFDVDNFEHMLLRNRITH